MENELLERARNGEKAALDQLLESVQPQIYRFSLKMCRHVEDAEDVLQESMIAMARNFQNFEGNSSFSTWLFTIARRFCIKKRLKGKFAPKVEESLEQLRADGVQLTESEGLNPEFSAQRSELFESISHAIRAMDPLYREVLLLRDMEGLKAQEVAEVLDISVAAVKSRLHRARAELRDALQKEPRRIRPGCPDIVQTLSEYLEGDLNPQICSEMEGHVAQCQGCAQDCNELKEALQICQLSSCEVPEDVQERISEKIREALLFHAEI